MTTTVAAVTMPEIVRPSVEQYLALQSHHVPLPSSVELFDFVVETLVTKGLAKYEHADHFRNRLPAGLFLLVPPKPKEFDLAHLMSLIEVAGKKGRNFLDTKHLTDEVEVHNGPYLMVDIDDGKARLNIKPSISRSKIKAENRLPYTTWRGIVHAVVFPEVFQSHNMDLVGSRYESKVAPDLYLSGGGPELDAGWDGSASPRWGAPSCGSVIVP